MDVIERYLSRTKGRDQLETRQLRMQQLFTLPQYQYANDARKKAMEKRYLGGLAEEIPEYDYDSPVLSQLTGPGMEELNSFLANTGAYVMQKLGPEYRDARNILLGIARNSDQKAKEFPTAVGWTQQTARAAPTTGATVVPTVAAGAVGTLYGGPWGGAALGGSMATLLDSAGEGGKVFGEVYNNPAVEQMLRKQGLDKSEMQEAKMVFAEGIADNVTLQNLPLNAVMGGMQALLPFARLFKTVPSVKNLTRYLLSEAGMEAGMAGYRRYIQNSNIIEEFEKAGVREDQARQILDGVFKEAMLGGSFGVLMKGPGAVSQTGKHYGKQLLNRRRTGIERRNQPPSDSSPEINTDADNLKLTPLESQNESSPAVQEIRESKDVPPEPQAISSIPESEHFPIVETESTAVQPESEIVSDISQKKVFPIEEKRLEKVQPESEAVSDDTTKTDKIVEEHGKKAIQFAEADAQPQQELLQNRKDVLSEPQIVPGDIAKTEKVTAEQRKEARALAESDDQPPQELLQNRIDEAEKTQSESVQSVREEPVEITEQNEKQDSFLTDTEGSIGKQSDMPESALFSRFLPKEQRVKGPRLPMKKTQKLVKNFQKNLTASIPVEIVPTSADLPFKTDKVVEGAYWNNRIYLVADNFHSTYRVKQVLLHEMFGHAMPETIGGKAYDDLLSEVMRNRPLEIKKLVKERGHTIKREGQTNEDPAWKKHRQEAAKELIARVAEKPETFKPAIIRTVYRATQRFINKMFGRSTTTRDMTDEHIEAFLNEMHQASQKPTIRGEGKLATITKMPEKPAIRGRGGFDWRSLMRKDAVDYAKENFRGNFSVDNTDTGWEVKVATKGIEETGDKSRRAVDFQAMEMIPELLKNGILVQTTQHKNPAKRVDISKVHYFLSPLQVDDKMYVVKIQINETNQGDKFYHQHLLLAGKTGTIDRDPPLLGRTAYSPVEASTVSIYSLLNAVKKDFPQYLESYPEIVSKRKERPFFSKRRDGQPPK